MEDMTDLALAVDIGGTKIATALVGPDGVIMDRAERATPDGDAELLWRAIVSLMKELGVVRAGAGNSPVRVRGVGIGSAGPVSIRAGTLSPLNIPGWHAFPIRERFTDLMGTTAVLAGDGICMALGEHWRGAGTHTANLLGIVVSTGVGGGLVLDGEPLGGRTGNAGHIGHLVVEPDGPECACGGRGCVEAIASGPALTSWARIHGWRAPSDRATARTVAAAARAGDEIASAAYHRAGTAVGRAIAGAAALLDLDLVVIGGGVAGAGALLFDPVRAAVAEHARLTYLSELTVVNAALGADAGLIGAAALIHRSP